MMKKARIQMNPTLADEGQKGAIWVLFGDHLELEDLDLTRNSVSLFLVYIASVFFFFFM